MNRSALGPSGSGHQPSMLQNGQSLLLPQPPSASGQGAGPSVVTAAYAPSVTRNVPGRRLDDSSSSNGSNGGGVGGVPVRVERGRCSDLGAFMGCARIAVFVVAIFFWFDA